MQEFCEWTNQKCVDQPDFLRIVFNTHIQQHKFKTMQQIWQLFDTVYIERHRRVLEIRLTS
jgi:hypothetical protein